MLHSFALYALSLIASPVTAPACETVGPRYDGTLVTICAGRVVRVTNPATGVTRDVGAR